MRNFLKYSSILKVLKVHYKCCAYHPSNYYKYQFRGGSRTATITKTDYDKELHLGCCSSSRSASAIYMKSSFKKTPWKVSFDLLNIFQRYSNNVCGLLGYGPILLSNDKTCYSYTLTKHYKLYVANSYYKDNPQKSYFDKVCKFLGKHQWQCSFLARL